MYSQKMFSILTGNKRLFYDQILTKRLHHLIHVSHNISDRIENSEWFEKIEYILCTIVDNVNKIYSMC